MRPVLGIIVLVLASWFFAALIGTPEETASAQTPSEWVSSEQCRECHAEIWEEWASSPHANSWLNEDVRVQSDQFANKDCIDCHAPRPIFETGLGERVLPRSSRRAEGVDCLTCHLLPSGKMAGKIDNPRAACQPTTRRELQRVEMCSGCHDQHKTVQQWKATPFAEHNEGCMECHMPYRDGTPKSGRIHTMPGGHYIEMVRSAVTFTAERDESGAPSVTIANVRGGHSYPTDERSRASDIWWRTLPAKAAPVDETGVSVDGGPWRHLHRIRDPYRHEKDMESTLLHFGESRTLTIDSPDAAGAVEAVLVYKRSPYYRDPETGLAREIDTVTDPFEDAELVHRVTVDPR